MNIKKTKRAKWTLKDLQHFNYHSKTSTTLELVEARESFIERMSKWKPSTIEDNQ